MSLTPEELFHFDTAGFLVRPAVLDTDQVAALRDQIERIYLRPDTLAPEERELPGGAASLLIDHPAILDVLETLLGADVRMETSEPMLRTKGQSFYRGFHRGSPYQADPIFGYRVEAGRVFLATIRVIVELTEVRPGDGATAFVIGSHKANFPLPDSYKTAGVRPGGDLVTGYACPAGSVVFFTEGVAHTGLTWRRDEPRIAVLNTYSNPAFCYHRPEFSRAVLDGLPPAKRAYFRPVWWLDQGSDPPRRNTAGEYLARPEPPLARAGDGAEPADIRLRRQSVAQGDRS
jgi:Phytanoyl-CoA dioxygenase (PhyH)